MQRRNKVREDNSHAQITYELYKQYYKCNDVGIKTQIIFRLFHNQICNDLREKKVQIVPNGFVSDYIYMIKYQYVMWFLNLKIQNWLQRIPLYKELISVVWHPKNWKKFKYLDEENFDDSDSDN